MTNVKHHINASLILLMIAGLLSCSAEKVNAPDTETPATTPPTAAAVVEAMGTGFNLGNTFDVGQHSTAPENIKPIIDLYYTAGMRHVRIPVTWGQGVNGSNLANENGIVNFYHTRFLQLKAVIQYALDKNMYVVLNTHHEHWLKDHYDGSAAADTVFTTLWRGIADHFKDYSDHLIFEILNEPEGAFGDWNGGPTANDPQALSFTRKINYVGYKAIRETGGRNSTRIIMVAPNGQGNQGQFDEVYPNKASLPGGGADTYLAVQVHTYDPWSFCGQTGRNSAWPGSASVTNAVNTVAAHAALLGVPINYGEFGVGRDANAGERNSDVVREYYRTMRLATSAKKMSATLWDDRGWFGMVALNGNNYDFLYNIVPTMMAP